MNDSIIGMLNQNQIKPILQNLRKIKQMMNMVKSANNPQLMLQQILQNNPKSAQLMQLINANGGNLEQAFYSLAQQMGVDPELILSELR